MRINKGHRLQTAIDFLALRLDLLLRKIPKHSLKVNPFLSVALVKKVLNRKNTHIRVFNITERSDVFDSTTPILAKFEIHTQA